MSDKKKNSAEETATATEEAQPEVSITESLVGIYDLCLNQDNKETFRRLGFALFHSLSDERALAELQKLGHKPKDALDFYNVGCQQAMSEKFGDAAKSFAQALKIQPEFPEAVYNHALSLEKSGDTNGARKAWKEYLDSCSDEAEAEQVREHLKELG